jgi:hypothetical protein
LGGNDRTTFFLSGGRNDQNGVMVGPHNYYDKTTVRLKASHRLTDRLNLTGNFAYTDARGFFVQKGSNLGGLLLGGLRTPPNYNNQPFLDPTSRLQRSYRFPHPSVQSLDTPRIYDNPFFVLNEDVNTSELGAPSATSAQTTAHSTGSRQSGPSARTTTRTSVSRRSPRLPRAGRAPGPVR